jgi:alpha-amylase
MASLDTFFRETGFPRAPKYYIMKWLTDYIREFGIDGYRVDTAKHTNEDVWSDFDKICQSAFAEYKSKNQDKVLDDNEFFLVGEVYGYGLHNGQLYDFGDKKVNYFENGLRALINFDFKGDANKDFEELFSYYSNVLHTGLKDYNIANYLTSHDDGQPFDKQRNRTFEAATKLLLSPGISQIYYGDETARSLEIEGTQGDATLRSFMNWDEVAGSEETKKLLNHYQKLGQFRAKHPAVGAGTHLMISANPYVFERRYSKNGFSDDVVVGLNLPEGEKTISIGDVFANGDILVDYYSDQEVKVANGNVTVNSPYNILLIGKQ